MTGEIVRSFLYPLGLFANLFFTLRFLIQWIQSEREKEVKVPKLFWIFSLAGNGIMACHDFIQFQFPLCLIQTANVVIAWRNLNLMSSQPATFKKTLTYLFSSVFLVILLFILQGTFLHEFFWMRTPSLPWKIKDHRPIHLLWHLIGFTGMTLFASRFWLQWWATEKHQKSVLNGLFWWCSLIGALFSLLYFIRLQDWINILGYGIGLIPYFRNLILLKKAPMSRKQMQNSVFLFAGEQSGDLIGSELIVSLRQQFPHLRLYGVGGPQMEKAGLEIFKPMSLFQVMGISSVLKSFIKILKNFIEIRNHILKENPIAVLFIDYPDFNMRLANALKKKNYPGKLIHYVCPSVWAWRQNRVYHLAKTLDLLISILPFEKEYFSKTSLSVAYVGHPLVDTVNEHVYDFQWKKVLNLPNKPILALFPGSRLHEIEHNLPLQLEAARTFSKTHAICISVARPDLEKKIKQYSGDQVFFIPHHLRYELMRDARAALATSGTVILELGLHATPTIATYRLSMLNYLLGRYLFRIRLSYYTLVNIISNKEIFPEFIHREISSKEITSSLGKLLEKENLIREECYKLRTLLEGNHASKKAAERIGELLHALPLS